jgi:hypothetical protein
MPEVVLTQLSLPEGAIACDLEAFAAMKKRAAELRAEGKKGAKKADGLQAVLDSIAAMAPEDRAMAERVHVTVTANAPELSPKTCQDAANLDEVDVWPVSYALMEWSPTAEKKLAELVKAAIS